MKKIPVGLKNAISNYSENLSSLREFVALIGPFLDNAQTQYIKEHGKTLLPLLLALSKLGPDAMPPGFNEEQVKELIGADIDVNLDENGRGTIVIKGDPKANEQFGKALQQMKSKAGHRSLLYRSSLISLISFAEWFLSQVLRRYFELHPDAAELRKRP